MFDYTYIKINESKSIEKFQRSQNHFCYFCRTTDKTKFKTEPHLTPELLGRNNYTHNHECDVCNEFFSGAYENDLANFIRPYLLTSLTKTKKGFPKYKDPKSGSSISIVDGKLNIRQVSSELKLVEFDHRQKTGKILIPRDPFNPFMVYKSLVKIGISMLPPEKLYLHHHTVEFLKDPKSTSLQIPGFCTAFGFQIEGKRFTEPSAELYEASNILGSKHVEFPQHFLILEFGNFVIQTFLPPSSDNIRLNSKGSTLGMEIGFIGSKFLHHKFDQFNAEKKMDLKTFNLEINRKIKGDIETYGISYESFV